MSAGLHDLLGRCTWQSQAMPEVAQKTLFALQILLFAGSKEYLEECSPPRSSKPSFSRSTALHKLAMTRASTLIVCLLDCNGLDGLS